MANAPRILIIGAGIGGLTAAVALHQRGFAVEVRERAQELGEVGAGLQIGPNAVKVLRALGLLDDYLKVAAQPRDMFSLNYNDASLRFHEKLAEMSVRAYGDIYTTVHRADLHALLAAALPASSIRTGAECVHVENIPGGARARFADGSTAEADVIVGADGIHSVVRGLLHGPDKPRFTRQMAWRCIVPVECVPTDVGPGNAIHMTSNDYVGWLGPNGHVICYPIRAGKLYNIFAGHVTDDWVEESWAVPSSTQELLDAYAGWNDALLGMLANVRDVYKWGIRDREPLAAYSRGRITVLGDAAHSMMPTLAQGAAQGMEDGAALARCLDDHRAELEAGLRAYDGERVPRASRVQLQARQQFLNNQMVPPPPPLDRSWIFRHDASTGQDMVADFTPAPI